MAQGRCRCQRGRGRCVGASAGAEASAGAGTSAAAERVKDQETLQPAAIVRQLANAIEHIVDDLLADCVVATGVVIRRILLATDQLLRVKEALVGALANFNVIVLNQ